jgi:hypothetical protein
MSLENVSTESNTTLGYLCNKTDSPLPSLFSCEGIESSSQSNKSVRGKKIPQHINCQPEVMSRLIQPGNYGGRWNPQLGGWLYTAITTVHTSERKWARSSLVPWCPKSKRGWHTPSKAVEVHKRRIYSGFICLISRHCGDRIVCLLRRAR